MDDAKASIGPSTGQMLMTYLRSTLHT
jgi:hypothetical protein